MRMKRTVAMLLSAILTLSLCLTALPRAARAAGDHVIQLGTGGIDDLDNVYFGRYSEYPDGTPWIVLPSDALSKSVASGTNVLPLLSRDILGNSQFRNEGGYYNYNSTSNTVSSSVLKQTLEAYYNGTNSIFTTNAERNAVTDTTLAGSSMNSDQSDLSGQKLFPLSLEEANGLWQDSSLRHVLRAEDSKSGLVSVWWLRTNNGSSTEVRIVDESGLTGQRTNMSQQGVRPAFYLDTSKVLFTAAADNSGQSASFSAPAAYSGTNWKLTLKDGNSFAAGASKTGGNTALTTGYAAEALTFRHAALSLFEGAGYTNVTAALTNAAGDLLYYGSINTGADATSSTVTIPAGLAAGSYTLSLYAEDRNANNTTDYATGTPFTQAITVTAPAPDIEFFHTSQLTNFNPPTIDFGTLGEGYTQPDAHTVYVKNIGSSDIWLEDLSVNPSPDHRFTITPVTNWSDKLPPSYSRWFTIQPVAGLTPGVYDTTIAIYTKDASGNRTPATLTLQIKLTVASAAPAIDFGAGTEFTDAATKTIDFGTVTSGYAQPTEKNVIIQNTGNINVKLESPDFAPSAQTGNYAVTLGYIYGNELAVREARYFAIQPNANLNPGNYDADITIHCKDKNGNALSASCTLHVKFTVTAATTPTVDVTPASSFLQGNAPTLRLTVGRNITGFGLDNLLSVTVTVNGTPVLLRRNTHYTATTGSILIDLDQSWLNTLAVGTYPVDIALQNGAYAGAHVYTSFRIVAPGGDGAGEAIPDVPKTGDNAPIALLVGLLLLSGAGLAIRRKRKARQ